MVASGDPEAGQYGDSLEPSERIGVPSLIPPWFMPQNNNTYFQEACDDVGGTFKEVHDTMIDAVKFAHNLWRLEASITGLNIMGPVAVGPPGCLKGSKIEPKIKTFPGCAAWVGHKAKWRDAIAKGVSDSFKKWQDMVTVPGLPWYPAFAAFPGPMAPPMPNVPTPLIACPSAGMAKMTTPMLKNAMCDAFDLDDPDDHFGALAMAIGTAVGTAFLAWLPMQQCMNVMGKGPIPTFAPPYVPVGPVVGGDNLPIPGHLAV